MWIVFRLALVWGRSRTCLSSPAGSFSCAWRVLRLLRFYGCSIGSSIYIGTHTSVNVNGDQLDKTCELNWILTYSVFWDLQRQCDPSLVSEHPKSNQCSQCTRPAEPNTVDKPPSITHDDFLCSVLDFPTLWILVMSADVMTTNKKACASGQTRQDHRKEDSIIVPRPTPNRPLPKMQCVKTEIRHR